VMQREIRAPDFVARYGGDEFALILPETDGEGGRRFVDRLRQVVNRHAFPELGPGQVPAMSAGVVAFPHSEALRPEDLFALAEGAADRAGEADAAGVDRAHGCAGRRRDPDAVPGDAGVVRAGRGAELVQDLAVHRPVELAQVGGRDRSGRGRGAPGLRLAARPLERGAAVVEAALVPLEGGDPLLRLARAASRLDERSLPR